MRQRFLRRITAFLFVLGACLLPATSFAQPSTTASLVWGQGGSFTTRTIGTSATTLQGAWSVAPDSSGNLYVSDSSNNRVLYYPAGSTTATKVYGQGGSFTTTSAGTSATALNDTRSIVLDSGGNLYVVDAHNNRVLYYPAGSTTATRVYGQGGSFTTNTSGASATALNTPTGVAVDSGGNVYIADDFNNRVLYYPSGSTTATRVYGQGGSFTTTAAGISATALSGPGDVAVDSAGNLYVADSGNNRVLYYPAGSTTATAVYGQGGSFTTGTSGTSATALNNPTGVALDSSGNLYVADFSNNRVLCYPAGSTTAAGVYGQGGSFTTNTSGTSATAFYYPSNIALDSSGNLYVADYLNNRVLEFAVPATGYTLSGPSGGAVSAASTNFTVTPNGNYTGTVTVTPSGGGLSTPIVLTFNSPASQTFTITPTAAGPVTLTPSNNGSLTDATALSYLTSPAPPSITSVTPGHSQITVAFTANATGGSAITGYAATCGPSTISGPSSPIVVTGLTDGTVYTCTVTATNTYGTSAASTASGPVTEPLPPATGFAFTGPSGGFVNTASGNFTVSPNGTYTGTVTITPSGGGLSTPIVLTFSSSSTAQTFTITPAAAGTVTLTPTNNGSFTNPPALSLTARVLPSAIESVVWGQGGSFTTSATGTSATALSAPLGVAVDSSGNLYASDAANNRVLYYPAGSTTATKVYGQSSFTTKTSGISATALHSPEGIALDSSGNLYVADEFNNRVLYYPAGSTTATKVYGQSSFTTRTSGTSASLLTSPSAVSVDSSGNLYITDSGNNRVLYYPAGSTTATAVYGQSSFTAFNPGTSLSGLSAPYGAAVDSNGNLYVADYSNQRVVFYPAGSTTATAVYGSLNPTGVAVDSSGNLFVADAINNRVLAYPAGSTTAAGVYGQSNFTATTSGTSATALHYPWAVALDSSGNLYVADRLNNRVVEFAVPATAYTLTGPLGGALSTASTNFTVTPNGTYTGTITITPSGGGLSTPIVLTFNSSAAQRFTITPTAAGPVTLTPSNNGSLTDAAALSYSTAPAAPGITSVLPGYGQLTVAFAANGTGGSAITGYAATCGSSTIPGSGSPIVVTGLTNGTAYTCTVTATNTYGTSAASTASNPVAPIASATTFTFTGPSVGFVNNASGSFTVTPNSSYTGTITITPSGGGLSTPIVLTFSNSSTAQTFTITPTAAGTVTLTPTNNGSLTNAASLTARVLPIAIESAVWGQGGSFTTSAAGTSATALNGPGSVALDSNGNLFVADAGNDRVLYYPAGSTTATRVYGQSSFTTSTFGGTSATALNYPGGIAVDGSGNLYVTDSNNNRVLYYPAGSTTATRVYGQSSFTTRTSGTSATALYGPSGLAVDSSGNLYVSDQFNNRVLYYPAGSTTATRVYGQSGFTTSAAGTSATALNYPSGIAVDGSGNLYVADLYNNRVLYYPAGSTTATLVYGQSSFTTGTSGTSATALNYPTGVALDNTGNLYVADSSNNRVLSYPAGSTTASGIYGQSSFTTSAAGTSATALNTPTGVAVDTSGNLYVSDEYNNRVVEFAAPATTYTLSGPTGGALSMASTNFTVTPNGTYTGTITITPSGGGLSTPIVLTFSSPASQTFTITPTSVGPVTLTPTNNGGLSDAAALSYSTPPAAPSITSVTPGNGQIAVAFTANATGGSAITGYAATCGSRTISGTNSPISVTGLTNGTAYTCTVAATNANGTSGASTASNSVTPVSGVSSYTFTGPAGGALSAASANFTVTPNGPYTGTITITQSGGGLSTATVLTFSNSSSAQTFAITPIAVGPVTLTPTNNGGLTDATALSYSTPPAAPSITSVTPGNGQIAVAFTANATGGSAITGYAATCGSRTISGTNSPISVTGLTNGTAYTCTVAATNANGTSGASTASNSVTPVSGVSSYTFTGPAGGALNAASANFTVTPNGPYTGTITITESGGGLSTATVLTFSNSSAAQTFTITPTAVGPVTLTPTNSGSLANPRALAYNTPPAAPTVTSATAGNAQITVGFTANGTGGSAITGYAATCGTSTIMGVYSPIVVTGLTNGTAYTCTVTATNAIGTSAASATSNAVTPYVPGYTFSGPVSGTTGAASKVFTVTPSGALTGTVTITPSGGGLTAPITLTFNQSYVPQTFTITPVSTGPVVLTPANSAGLVNPPVLTYTTSTSSITITSATPANGSIEVYFTTAGGSPQLRRHVGPAADSVSQGGGAQADYYQAACVTNPATTTYYGQGAGSPILVTGLANGTPYVCTVTAIYLGGNAGTSNPYPAVTPSAPSGAATGYTLSGPLGGAVGTASTNFTVTPNGTYTGAIAVGLSGGGLSGSTVLTFNGSYAPQTFTITPSAIGPVTLTPSSNGSLTDAAALSYATGPGVLAAPVATPGNGLISVAFAAGTATGGAQADYYTASCTAGNTVYFGQNTATPVVVTGLTNGTTYTCSVTATNFVGTSAASAASNAATPMAPASLPSAPTIVSVTAGPGSATVAFTAPTNTGGLPITGYAATCGSVTVQGTSSPITVAWLFGGGSFNCSVAAMNAIGTGPSSASIAVTPLSTFPPATGYVFAGPLGGPVGKSSSNFTLTPNNSFYGNITVTPSGGGLSTPITLNWAGSGVAQPFTITPLTVGPVVLTPNSNGGLPDAAPLIYSTPPAAPAMGGATWSNGTVSVAFTPGANGGSPITAYTAVCSASNAPLLTATGAASPIVLAGLNGTAYTCAVTATNAFGTSLASAASNYVTPGVPGSPLSVSAAAGNGQATVTFAAPAAIGVPPVTGYTVVSSPGGVAVHAAASPVTVTGLTNGTAYTFTVTAANGYGSGPGAVSNSVTPSAGSQTLSMLQPLFPVGVQGAEYPVQILSASGGTLPYTYSVDTGALPSGLALAGSAFGGTPTSAGETAFTIRVTDAAGNSVSSAASISIEPVGPDLILSDALVSSIPASVAVRSSDVTQMLGYTVAAADPWLVVSGGRMAPGSISVEAAPGLAAGTYRSEITVSCAAASACAGSTKTVAVVLNVAAAGPVTQVDRAAVATPDGAQFRAPAGNPLGNPVGSFTAAGTWLASVLPGANWLSLTSQAGAVNFTVDPLQAAGVYSGTIRVTSADGSQIDHAVVLDVLAAGTPVKPELSAAGLTFAQGAAAAQQVSVYAGSSVPLAYQAAASAAWLSVSPVTGTAMAGAPGSSVISVNPAGLAPGVYRGGVSYAFASDAVRTVNVTMVVPSLACDPAQLVATHNGLPQNFQTAVGLPVELTMNVVNGCGAPVSSAQVTAAFSNGDAPVMLRAVDGAPGMYTGGWMPQAAGSQVAVTATAVGQTGTALAVITGKVTPY